MSLVLGWGLMRGIKIPQQYFVLKRQGGLMREGGVFAGHYGICTCVCVRRENRDRELEKLALV